MKDKTKVAIVGGLLGTIFLGPGLGTLVGTALARETYERQNGVQDADQDDYHPHDPRDAQ